MKIGFTGTQRGMNLLQKRAFTAIIADLLEEGDNYIEFHHGDCVGADENAATIVSGLIPDTAETAIIIHPPELSGKRAFCKIGRKLEGKPYLDRNKDIVDACEILIACPKGKIEELRSGTWSTVRYARKNVKRIILIYPNGTIEHQ